MMRIALAIAMLALAGFHRAGESPPAPYPDPSRLAEEIAAFARHDSVEPPPARAIVCAGSSSMRRWHDRIREDLAPLTVIPRGFGGSTMWDVLAHAGSIIAPYRPRALLLYEGDNDIDFGVTPEAVLSAFRQLVARLRADLPALRIYVLAIKPSPARWRLWPAMRRANALLAAECAGDSLLSFIDAATPMLGERGLPRTELYLDDGLHLSPAGYDLWAAIVGPRLREREARWEAPPGGDRR